MTRSNVTLACVLPITPMRCPDRPSRLLILATADRFEPLTGEAEGAQRTTTFFLRIATDSASAGISRSPRATAKWVFDAAISEMLSEAPSVEIGDSRTALLSRANVWPELIFNRHFLVGPLQYVGLQVVEPMPGNDPKASASCSSSSVAVADSLKALDLKRPIREADISRGSQRGGWPLSNYTASRRYRTDWRSRSNIV
jgi:hypothetical protein